MNRLSFRLFVLLSFNVLLLPIMGLSYAQDDDDDDPVDDYVVQPSTVNHLGRDEVSIRLEPLGFGLMGDSIDPYTGTLVFNQTDVSLPGNSELEVAIRRTASTGDMTNMQEMFFGDWILDVPNISSLSPREHWGYFTCIENQYDEESTDAYKPYAFDSNGNLKPIGSRGQSKSIPAAAYWDGLKLNIPGQGSRLLLEGSKDEIAGFYNSIWRPFDEQTKYYNTFYPNAAARVTKDHWVVTCLNPRVRAPGEPYSGNGSSLAFDGYVAISPNGTRYRMDRKIVTPADEYRDNDNYIVKRNLGKYYATEVTDVNGNWVRYHYSTEGKLLSIYSNDGRRITLTYVPGSNRVATVKANGRTWRYSYRPVNEMRHGKFVGNVLHKVTQPDWKYWEYKLDFLTLAKPSNRYYQQTEDPLLIDTYVKHPYGVVANYELKKIRHELTDDSNIFVSNHRVRRTISVTKKTLSGPSIPTSEWTYDYEQYDRYIPFSNPATKTTTVTDPTGRKTVSHYLRGGKHDGVHFVWLNGNVLDSTIQFNLPTGSAIHPKLGVAPAVEGKLIKKERFDTDGSTLLEVVDNSYLVGPKIGDNAALARGPLPKPELFYKVYKTKTVTKRDGDTFTREFNYGTNLDSSYSYGKALNVKASSNVSTTARETVATYTHRKDKWILGLTNNVKTNGRLLSSYTYDSFGRVTKEYEYGALVATLGYHSNPAYKGALYSIKDPLNRTTYLLNYNAGVPKNIRRPDNKEDEQIVDANGWIRSQKDYRGYKTTYSYDSMGRVTRVTPDQSLYGWRETKIRYTFGATNIAQHISDPDEEDYVETITYDQLFRPVLEYKEDWYTEWRSYVNTRYNTNGQVEFKSQPSTNRYETKGVDYTYDGLNRLKTHTENVSPYAKTSINYLSSHQKRITDPNGNVTTYRFSGYEGPGQGAVTHIFQPMGVTTHISRNVHDQVIYVRQYGNHNGYYMNKYNHYYYDSRQRLCRHRTPESGDTVSYYDSANRTTWTAQGQSSRTSCSQSAVPGNQRVTYTYDILDRVKIANYPDSSPDVYTTYDANGNVLTKNRGGANWTYTYNELNKLTSENLSIDGRSYNTSYGYNYAGFLSRQITPFNRTIYFNSDSFGGASSVRAGSTYYARDISYHPNRALKSMEYGNGFYHDVVLNARQLPYRLHARKGGTRSLLLYHYYDANENITQILDYSDSTRPFHKYMTYDGLDRLKTANAPNAWGNGTFKYDPLGNLRQKTLGNRTVNINYNSLNRVISVNDAGVSRNFGYDTRGNVTNNGERTFTYDRSNQPTYMSGAGSYKYDGNHKRVKSVVNGKTTYSVYGLSGNLLYLDKVTDNKKIEYIHAAGKTIARIENGVPGYTHNDLLGSALSSTTSSGGIKWREQYTPFGEKWLNPSGNKDNVGFTGHIQDDRTGLTYMQARYYDPDIGRFLSIDPVGFRPSKPSLFNRYAYASNNPYRYLDPDGRDSTDANDRAAEEEDEQEDEALEEIVVIGERPDDFMDGWEDFHFAGIDVPGVGFDGEGFESQEEWMEHRLKYNAWYALQDYGGSTRRAKGVKPNVKGGKAGKDPNLASQEAWFFLYIINGLRDFRYPYMQQMPEGVGIGEPGGPFDPTMVF